MPKRILVVDDELDNNKVLEAILEENGFEVDCYADPLCFREIQAKYV
jgi:CheY-like chemotaxis protein